MALPFCAPTSAAAQRGEATPATRTGVRALLLLSGVARPAQLASAPKMIGLRLRAWLEVADGPRG
jgi:hypothetical protein